jgi:capsular exopolysaccharide synthesis family protein
MSELPMLPPREPQRGLVVYSDQYSPPPQQPQHAAAFQWATLLTALRRNALLIVAVAAVTAGVAYYRFSRQLPQYKASALVRLSDVRRSLTGGLAGQASEFESWRVDPLKSQLEVLRGRSTLGSIVDTLGLRLFVSPPDVASDIRSVVSAEAPDDASARVHFTFGDEGFTAAAGGASFDFRYGQMVAVGPAHFTVARHPGVAEAEVALLPRESAISALSGGLQLRLREGTDAVDVEYTAYDPRLARQVVNTAIHVFQDASAYGARQESRRRRIFLEEQLRQSDAGFREVQAALTDFRARRQLFSSREQLAAQQEGLRDLDLRRAELAGDRRIFESALAELSRPGAARADVLRRVGAAPGIAANPVVSQLYTQLLAQQSVRDSLVASGATAGHPDVRRADAAIAASEGRLVDALRSHVASLDSRLGALDGLRAQSAGQMQTLPTAEAEEVRLAQQVEAMSRASDQLREELQRARIAEAVESGQVQIIHPAPAAGQVGAPMSIKMAIALFFGLGLGIGVAFVRERLDTTIRDRGEVERILRAPKLATIPRLVPGSARADRVRHFLRRNGDRRNHQEALVSVDRGSSWEAEAYRTLRTNLIFSQSIRTLKRVVVTSAIPGEGKTTTVTNLAVTFAQQGLNVLLVDCDLRRPTVHKVFKLKSEPGFTQLALGFATADEAIRGSGVQGLSILPAGALPPNPAELLGGEQSRALFDTLSSLYDIVLIDTSPIMAASDAAILASHCDGVLLVVRAGYADRNAVQAAADQLATVGARVVGAVFNDADASAVPYDKSYHKYKSYYSESRS